MSFRMECRLACLQIVSIFLLALKKVLAEVLEKYHDKSIILCDLCFCVPHSSDLCYNAASTKIT
jgi:hypothetical protein